MNDARGTSLVATLKPVWLLIAGVTLLNVAPAHHLQYCLYQGLDVREAIMKRTWLNRFLVAILKGEVRYLSRPHRRLPYGHTIMCLEIKPL